MGFLFHATSTHTLTNCPVQKEKTADAEYSKTKHKSPFICKQHFTSATIHF
jgi:hypothetical protein